MRKILSRFAAMLQIKIVTSGFRWALFLIAHQQLNKQDFADFAAIFSILELARIFSDFGIEPYLYTKLRGPDKPIPVIWKRLISIKVAASTTVAISLVAYGICCGEKYYIYGAPIIIFWSLNMAFNALSQKYELMADVGLMANKISILAIIFIGLSYFGIGVTNHIALMAIFEAAIGLGFLYILIASGHKIYFFIMPNRVLTKRIAKVIGFKLKSAYIVQMLSAAYQRADALVVLPLLGSKIQSNYSAGYRFTEPIVQLFSILAVGVLINTNSNRVVDVKNFILMMLAKKNIHFLAAISVLMSLAVIAMSLYQDGKAVELDTKYFIVSFAIIIPMRVCGIVVSSILLRLNKIEATTAGTFVSVLTILVLLLIFGPGGNGAFILAAYIFGEFLNLLYQSYRMIQVVNSEKVE